MHEVLFSSLTMLIAAALDILTEGTSKHRSEDPSFIAPQRLTLRLIYRKQRRCVVRGCKPRNRLA